MLSYDSFIRGKIWKSQGAKSGQMIVGDQNHPIENASGASLLQLQYAAEHSSSLVLNKGIELQHALHIWRGTPLFWSCLRAHYALRTDKCYVSRSPQFSFQHILRYHHIHFHSTSSDPLICPTGTLVYQSLVLDVRNTLENRMCDVWELGFLHFIGCEIIRFVNWWS